MVWLKVRSEAQQQNQIQKERPDPVCVEEIPVRESLEDRAGLVPSSTDPPLPVSSSGVSKTPLRVTPKVLISRSSSPDLLSGPASLEPVVPPPPDSEAKAAIEIKKRIQTSIARAVRAASALKPPAK